MTKIAAWLTIGLQSFNNWINSPEGYAFGSGQLIGFDKVRNAWIMDNFGNYSGAWMMNKWLFLGITGVLSMMMIPIFLKIGYKNHSTNHSQYGNDRFASTREILRQYPIIPDREFEFKGVGGVPVLHVKPWDSDFMITHPIMFAKYTLWPAPFVLIGKVLAFLAHCKITSNIVSFNAADWFETRFETVKGYYAIDQTTVNSMIVGITRSGKGETEIMPTIDILSRAEVKSSFVANDPKGELYQMSYETLRKRGYNVQVLNIQDSDFSMSYNPLQNIIKYAKEGYYDEVQQEVNTLSSSIYTDPNAKDKFWQNSSINLLNSLILAVIDYAKRNDAWEQVTMDNVLHMMTDLGSKQVVVDSDNNIVPPDEVQQRMAAQERLVEKNKLLIYFAKLQDANKTDYGQFRQMALDAFAQSKFAGDETSGNIYSSAMEGIKIYQQTNIAKMTSLNSVDFESIGFPRTMKFRLPEVYKFATAIVTFADEEGKVIEKRTQIVDKIGILNYAIEAKLPDIFTIKIDFNFRQNSPEISNDYLLVEANKIYKRSLLDGLALDKYTGKPILKHVDLQIRENELIKNPTEMILNYSESPTALFLVTPPNNPSYNQLPAFAVDQIFNIIYNAALNNGRKAFTRVHFLLDEFGNLPTIANMDTKVSIGLGQNLLFDIVVQNLEQLEINYSKHQAATIQSNCANLLYILTSSEQTAKNISNRLGKRTVDVYTKNGQAMNPHSVSVNSSLISQDLLTAPELMRFMGGEMVVLRSVYRQDQKGNSVSAFPIFDHAATEMPYRYTFLKKEFNDKTTLSDIGIISSHRSLDLKGNRINYDEAYSQVESMIPSNEQHSKIMNIINENKDNNINEENIFTASNNVEISDDFEDSVISFEDPNNVLSRKSDDEYKVILESEWVNLASANDLAQLKANLYQLALQANNKNELDLFDKTSNEEFWNDYRYNNWDYVKKLLSVEDNNNHQLVDSFKARVIALIDKISDKTEIPEIQVENKKERSVEM